jgi:hypothetical protein
VSFVILTQIIHSGEVNALFVAIDCEMDQANESTTGNVVVKVSIVDE